MKRIVQYLIGTEAKKIALSFLAVIFSGSLLLTLPIAQRAGSTAGYLENLFTSVSMVCVTGLTVISVKDTYTTFGQIICMILMQIGGLSLMTFLAISTYYLKKNISLSNQYLFQSSINRDTNADLTKFLIFMLKFTFAVEGLCTLVLMTQLVPMYGWGEGIFNSIFTSVSAFNNAGFDNMGATSLIDYADNSIILLPIAFSIIFSGLGFSVWYEVLDAVKHFFKSQPKRWKLTIKKLSIHSKSVILTTFWILVIGTFFSWAIEWQNMETIGKLSLYDQFVNSFFQTVSMRTAGFATLDYTKTYNSTNLLYILQMIIGGAPGGTAGGIKITTLVIIVMYLRAEVRGNTYISLFKRTISTELFRRAISVFSFYMLTLLLGYLLILMAHPELEPFDLFYECVSALSTVGVSANITANLSTVGRFIVMALMFLGRVGPLTVFVSLTLRQADKDDYEHANVDLLIG